jgi:hypothetical protein
VGHAKRKWSAINEIDFVAISSCSILYANGMQIMNFNKFDQQHHINMKQRKVLKHVILIIVF